MSKIDRNMVLIELGHLYRAVSTPKGYIVPSGSYFICGCEDNDVDFFAHNTDHMRKHLKERGYIPQIEESYFGEEAEALRFVSYRKDYFNVILLESEDELAKIQLATDLCIALETEVKEHRILIFRAIRTGSIKDPNPPKPIFTDIPF